MPDVARPHRTRPVEVLITEPLTTANRGEIARWLEDQGIEVGVPAVYTDFAGLLLDTRRDGEAFGVALGSRVVVNGSTVDVVDHAHYKLWYEPAANVTTEHVYKPPLGSCATCGRRPGDPIHVDKPPWWDEATGRTEP